MVLLLFVTWVLVTELLGVGVMVGCWLLTTVVEDTVGLLVAVALILVSALGGVVVKYVCWLPTIVVEDDAVCWLLTTVIVDDGKGEVNLVVGRL